MPKWFSKNIKKICRQKLRDFFWLMQRHGIKHVFCPFLRGVLSFWTFLEKNKCPKSKSADESCKRCFLGLLTDYCIFLNYENKYI